MSAIQAAFEAEMNSGRPIVDNANDRLWGPNGQYDGPRCADPDCDTPVDDDGATCGPCAAHRECTRCQGDGCDWHLSPTNGAVEIDCACPACKGTGRTPR